MADLKVIKCSCWGEIITVEIDKEDDDLTYLAVWSSYTSNPVMGLKERIRWVWHLLVTGQPYTDMVVLNKEERSKLIAALTED